MIKYLVLITILLFSSCEKEQGKTAIRQEAPRAKKAPAFHNHDVKIDEVLQTSKYTYFRFLLHEKDTWAAVTKREMNTGDIFPFSGGSEMQNFVSKELDRTFESILFIADKEKHNHPAKKKAKSSGKPKMNATVKKVEKASGGITIAELFKNMNSYSGKEVTIRAEITKYNAQIIKANWFHVQDGTNHNGLFDLTVTTQSEVKVGETVLFKGKVSLNKDFGYGYKYDIIVEDAVIL